MADLKISALTGATTPLAGTEVLPIVQSSTTKQVSVANLTAGRAVSVASLAATGTVSGAIVTAAGILQSTSFNLGHAANRVIMSYEGGGNGYIQPYGTSAGAQGSLSIRCMSSDGSLSTIAAQFDASNVTINTGNVVMGTAAKGINFTANTPAAGKTSQLLNWYEEGTWTPVDSSGAGLTLTYTAAEMRYTRIGRNVFIQGRITYPSTASGATALIGGLPFTSSASNRAGISLGYNNFVANYVPLVSAGSALLEFYTVASGGVQPTNANLSAATFAFSGTYTV